MCLRRRHHAAYWPGNGGSAGSGSEPKEALMLNRVVMRGLLVGMIGLMAGCSHATPTQPTGAAELAAPSATTQQTSPATAQADTKTYTVQQRYGMYGFCRRRCAFSHRPRRCMRRCLSFYGTYGGGWGGWRHWRY